VEIVSDAVPGITLRASTGANVARDREDVPGIAASERTGANVAVVRATVLGVTVVPPLMAVGSRSFTSLGFASPAKRKTSGISRARQRVHGRACNVRATHFISKNVVLKNQRRIYPIIPVHVRDHLMNQ
jgi:hypothetical protein